MAVSMRSGLWLAEFEAELLPANGANGELKLKPITAPIITEWAGAEPPIHDGAWNARGNDQLSREEQDVRVRVARLRRARRQRGLPA